MSGSDDHDSRRRRRRNARSDAEPGAEGSRRGSRRRSTGLRKAGLSRGRDRTRLGAILIELGLIDAAALGQALAVQAEIGYHEPGSFRPDVALMDRLAMADCADLIVAPLGPEEDGRIGVVVEDPTDIELRMRVGAALDGELSLSLATADAIAQACLEARERHQRELEANAAPVELEELSEVESEPLAIEVKALGDLSAWCAPAMATAEGADNLICALLGDLLAWHGSVLELRESSGLVLMDLDGTRLEHGRLMTASWRPIVQRLLRAAALDAGSSADRLRDRRIPARLGPRSLSFRASISGSPGNHELRLAVRDPGALASLEQLGVPADDLRRLRQWTAAREGLVLVVGPPDSGRSSTLAAVARLVGASRPTALVQRDPVTVPPGVTSWEPGPEPGAALQTLRAALESDAAVLVLDDLTEREYAEEALRAGANGRLVIASLTGDDTGDALQWLKVMGVRDGALGPWVLGVFEQQLVRLLCGSCWQKRATPKSVLSSLGLVVDSVPAQSPSAGPGCPRCHGTGFKGRRPLFSRVELTDGIPAASSEEELEMLLTLSRPRKKAELGILLAMKGLTSIEELGRVLLGADGDTTVADY